MFLDVNIDVNQLTDQLNKIGTAIANSASPVIQHAYAVYVRQQIVDGYRQIAIGAVLLVVSAIAIYLSTRAIKNANSNIDARIESPKKGSYYHYSHDDYDKDVLGAGWVVIVISAIVSLIAIYVVINGAGLIINPEYGAINDLISNLKN